jgi:NADH-quinone oxidoreductase subunit K
LKRGWRPAALGPREKAAPRLFQFSIFNFQFHPRAAGRGPPANSQFRRKRSPMPSTSAYLMLSATLFAAGLVGVILRRNMITVLMCIELMLNAVNINLVAFSNQLANLEGQVFAIFVITVAAGEAAVGLALMIQLYRLKSTVNIDEVRELNG